MIVRTRNGQRRDCIRKRQHGLIQRVVRRCAEIVRVHGLSDIRLVRMRFHELKEAPKGQGYILWAVSSDNQFQRLGEIVNVKGRNEAEIRSETSFNDFGLLLTTEDRGLTRGTIIRPSGHRVGVIEIIK